MKRTFFSLILALSALGAGAQVAPQAPASPYIVTLPAGQTAPEASSPTRISSNQRWLGLYDSDNLAQFGRGFPAYPGEMSAAVSLKADMLQPHVGSKVVGIRFGLCEPIGESRVFIFNSDRYGNGQDIVSQKVIDTQKGWNTVMLDEPIDITTEPDKEWLIGFDYYQYNYKENDEYISECYPLSCVAEGVTGQPLQLYYEPAGTGSGKSWHEFNLEDYNLSVQLLIQGNYYQYDVVPADFGNIPFEVGSEVSFPVQFTNNSTEDAVSLDYTVTIDGETGEAQHIDLDPAVAPARRGTLTLQLPLGNEPGTHEVEVHITKVNGQDNASSATAAKGTVSIYADKYPRNLVIEEFTTELCPNCPRVASLLAYYMEAADPTRVAAVCHHSAYYTDWLTQDCDRELTYLYNDDGKTYAPGLMFNRQPDFDALYAKGNMDNIMFPNSYNDLEAYANYQLTLFSDAQLTMRASLNDDGTTATVTVSGECNNSLDEGQNRITLYLTEDDIEAQEQYGASGDWYHQHVIRYYNSTWGDPIVWQDNRFTATYSIAIDPTWKRGDLKLVAFLNKYNAEDKLDNRIENSIGMTLNEAVTTVKGMEHEPNATETARYNAAGQRIQGPQKGLNIVKLSDGSTQKVMVR